MPTRSQHPSLRFPADPIAPDFTPERHTFWQRQGPAWERGTLMTQ